MRGRYRDTPAGEMRTAGLYGALTGPGIKTAGPTPPGGEARGLPCQLRKLFLFPQFAMVRYCLVC